MVVIKVDSSCCEWTASESARRMCREGRKPCGLLAAGATMTSQVKPSTMGQQRREC